MWARHFTQERSKRGRFWRRVHRLKWKQESSRFFEKKRRKKRLRLWAGGSETSTAQCNKVLLLVFVHKN